MQTCKLLLSFDEQRAVVCCIAVAVVGKLTCETFTEAAYIGPSNIDK